MYISFLEIAKSNKKEGTLQSPLFPSVQNYE